MAVENDKFDMASAPHRIGRVRLKVRDLARVSDFYQRVIGLTVEAEGESRIALGIGAETLLELEGDGSLDPRDPRQAGLFHTAFLLPQRSDLARWVAFVRDERIPLEGASDHIVSEALYLSDPEGNGIEVYADRPPSEWRRQGTNIEMATNRLDLEGLLGATEGLGWKGFPARGAIGHVHLQVGDTARAEAFYSDVLGFDVMARYPGASFFGSGGYHHQLAGNTWNSRGAGSRSRDMAGLAEVEIIVRDGALLNEIRSRAEERALAVEEAPGALSLSDAWDTRLVLRADL